MSDDPWAISIGEYQEEARTTAIYPAAHYVTYPLIGLVGEVGEFANKYKKTLRDGTELDIEEATAELGDILWYLSNLCYDLRIDLAYVANRNLDKLQDRKNRGVIGGSGDNR